MIIKKCKICGEEFEAKSNRACYCSDKCKKEGQKEYDYNKFNRLNPDKANAWKQKPENKKIINHNQHLKYLDTAEDARKKIKQLQYETGESYTYTGRGCKIIKKETNFKEESKETIEKRNDELKALGF